MAGRNPLKDKLEDEELDLSMMQLTDVPVRVGQEDEDQLILKLKFLGHRAAWNEGFNSQLVPQFATHAPGQLPLVVLHHQAGSQQEPAGRVARKLWWFQESEIPRPLR